MGEKKPGKKAGGLFSLFDLKKPRNKFLSNGTALSKSTSKGQFADKSCSSEQCGGGAVGFTSLMASADVSSSSLKTDEENGIKVPGVVARLMGLDSLPAAPERKVTPFNDSHSFQGSRIVKNRRLITYTNDQFNHEIGRDDANSFKAVNKPDVASSPIDRFCMEMLPLKLMKSPNHDNFSVSMKNPVVIPQSNLLLWQEESKFLDHQSLANLSLKANSFSPSTTASKYKYSKETLIVPAPAKPAKLPVKSLNSAAAKSLGEQPFDRVLNVSEVRSCEGKLHGKEICSPDKRVTENVRASDQLSSNNRRKLLRKDPKPHRSLNCQNGRQLKTRAENEHVVARKSSLTMKKEDSSSILTPNLKSHTIYSSPEYKSGNKLPGGVSLSNGKRTSVIAGKQVNDLAHGDRGLPHKKGFMGNNIINSEEKSTVGKSQMDSCAKCILHNFIIDEHSRWRDNNMKNCIDVVSFTFATPIVKPELGHDITSGVIEGRGLQKENSLGIGMEEKVVCFTTTKQLSTEFNDINGDALGILLEEKLKELVARINPPYINSSKAISESPVVPHDSVFDNHISSTSGELESFNCESYTNDEGSMFQFGCSLADAQASGLTQAQQEIDDIETSSCSSSSSCHIEVQKEPDHPSPLSILEASFSPYGSYDSPVGLGSTSESLNSIADHDEECNQESKYVREILSACLMSNSIDFCHDACSGNTLNPHLFNELECKGSWSIKHREAHISCRLERKVLFDCVGEFLDTKVSLFFKAGYRAWSKGTAVSGKGLAEQACKEISAWRSMEGWLVEPLMDWDMSNKLGRWVDFEVEAFEVGEEIERGLLSSLVEELVDGFLTGYDHTIL